MEIYFSENTKQDKILESIPQLFEKANKKCIKKGDLVAVKIHFGEPGNKTYLKPIFVSKIVEEIKKVGGKPFVTDANTIYFGRRRNSVDHLNSAYENGFTPESIGAPIIIADGLWGKNFRKVTINQKYFKEVSIAGDIVEADSLVVISHVKGHLATGMGACLKNMGMGCASPAGKQQQHSDIKPKVQNNCIRCGVCLKWCPADAITMTKDQAVINPEKCIGCAECVSSCKFKAININWQQGKGKIQERMVEYALGVLKGKENKTLLFNFILDVTPDCDCFPKSDLVIIEDIGVLAGTDPIAIDKASFDLVNSKEGIRKSRLKDNHSPGKDKFFGVHEVNAMEQIEYGEKIGLGKKEYTLKKL